MMIAIIIMGFLILGLVWTIFNNFESCLVRIEKIESKLIDCQKQADTDRKRFGENATKAQQSCMDLYFKLGEKDLKIEEAMLAIAAKIEELEGKIK